MRMAATSCEVTIPGAPCFQIMKAGNTKLMTENNLSTSRTKKEYKIRGTEQSKNCTEHLKLEELYK